MSLNLQDKQAIVAEVNKIAKKALSAVIADYCGVSVNNINNLRKRCRETGVYMRVVPNTLLYRAVNDTSFECLKDTFFGPTLIAYSMEHPGTAASLFKEFAKTNTQFEIKAAVFDGKLLQVSQIDLLANIPTYEKAIACLMILMKEASVGKLIYILTAILRSKEAN